MNEGRPYLQTWRGVWVSFCKIAIVSFLSVGYKSDGLYCRMAGTPSSPTLFFKRVESREVEINIKYKINNSREESRDSRDVGKGSHAREKLAGRALVLARGVRCTL